MNKIKQVLTENCEFEDRGISLFALFELFGLEKLSTKEQDEWFATKFFFTGVQSTF